MEQLKKLRQSHHLSQQKLAEEFHISQQSIWKYENAVSDKQLTPIESALVQNYRSASAKMQKLIFDLLNEISQSS